MATEFPLQSLFVWILWWVRYYRNEKDASILVRVDIILIFVLNAGNGNFNPCSCGYYFLLLIASLWVFLQSLFVWILFHELQRYRENRPSILVRVDIIQPPSCGICGNAFNPCSCGYYGYKKELILRKGLQSLFVWILWDSKTNICSPCASILVRVDIMDQSWVICSIYPFNPCSCGYYWWSIPNQTI